MTHFKQICWHVNNNKDIRIDQVSMKYQFRIKKSKDEWHTWNGV